MPKPKFFISIDWGSTNFRLRIAEKSTLKIHYEFENGKGINKVYQLFEKEKNTKQQDFFLHVLKKELKPIPDLYKVAPIVISGMASSNIGIKELKYAELPFSSSPNLITKKIEFSTSQNLYIISGVKTSNDVMRGEETQAIGLIDSMNKDGILLLPGTHSKHLQYSANCFIEFKTFITGELFGILSKHSVLKQSLDKRALNKDSEKAFIQGVNHGVENLSSKLFSIRATHVLNQATKQENYYYLSGLLIGNELSYLSKYEGIIYMAATKNISDLYALALDVIVQNGKWIAFDERTYTNALLKGQLNILSTYE